MVDSGASDHLVTGRDFFVNEVKLQPAVMIKVAKKDASVIAENIGTIVVNVGELQIEINNVLFVPELKSNLLSIRRLVEKGFSVVFDKDCVFINKGDNIVAKGYREGVLYKIHFDLPEISESGQALTAEQTVDWHRRLGHVNYRTLSTLKKLQVIDKIEINDIKCETCIRGKMCRLPFRKKTPRTTRPLQLIHVMFVVQLVLYQERDTNIM